MLTLFTTAKKFLDKNRINQLNAIRSWFAGPYQVEVIIFDKVEGDGIEELYNNPDIQLVEEIEANENGVPLINHMFAAASKLAQYEILCFLNADIILTDAFFNNIKNIQQQLKKNYLVVGQRIDVDVDSAISFTNNWLNHFFDEHPDYEIHPPSGSDFFAFPKGQYTLDNMPDLLVGRPGWDLWMIYNARFRRLKVVDLSFASKVIHQNHDYSHKKKDVKEKEDEFNYQFIAERFKYTFTLTSCNYLYKNKKIKRNIARGDLELYDRYFNWLPNKTIIEKVRHKLFMKKAGVYQLLGIQLWKEDEYISTIQ